MPERLLGVRRGAFDGARIGDVEASDMGARAQFRPGRFELVLIDIPQRRLAALGEDSARNA